jgi:hypothetical protein
MAHSQADVREPPPAAVETTPLQSSRVEMDLEIQVVHAANLL